MKKIFFGVLFLSACHKINPKQEQADNLIKTYVNAHLTGQNDYQTISYGKLMAMRTNYFNTTAGINLNKKITAEYDSLKSIEDQDSILLKNAKANWRKIKVLRAREFILGDRWEKSATNAVDLSVKFKGQLRGYKIYYSYKADNKLSIPTYHRLLFKFDTSLLKITSVKDTIIDASDVNWK